MKHLAECIGFNQKTIGKLKEVIIIKVKYIGTHETPALDRNKIYEVIAIEKDWYRIMTELDEDYLFPPEVFEAVSDFTVQQIAFMKALGLKIDFDNLTDDDLIQIEEVVGEKLQKSGFDQNNEVTADGRMCESILDRLS